MLHKMKLEQKALCSAFTVNISYENLWGNLYHFISGKRGKKKKVKI